MSLLPNQSPFLPPQHFSSSLFSLYVIRTLNVCVSFTFPSVFPVYTPPTVSFLFFPPLSVSVISFSRSLSGGQWLLGGISHLERWSGELEAGDPDWHSLTCAVALLSSPLLLRSASPPPHLLCLFILHLAFLLEPFSLPPFFLHCLYPPCSPPFFHLFRLHISFLPALSPVRQRMHCKCITSGSTTLNQT